MYASSLCFEAASLTDVTDYATEIIFNERVIYICAVTRSYYSTEHQYLYCISLRAFCKTYKSVPLRTMLLEAPVLLLTIRTPSSISQPFLRVIRHFSSVCSIEHARVLRICLSKRQVDSTDTVT